jgi:biotin carboxyl carrier protein
MKTYRITLENQTFEVKVLGDPRRAQVQVEVNGIPFTVGVEAARPAAQGRPTTTSPAASPTTATPSVAPTSPIAGNGVAAPLPGVIKSIAVQPGQQVSAGDELLVIEAMKMDNVIRAARAGTVAVVHVTEGRQVAHGEPLLEFAD